MSADQIKEITLSIEEAQDFVKRGEALERLHKNRDFRKIILEGLFKDEAVRLVNLKAAPQMQHEQHQANILREIDGIGSLRNYFRAIYQAADQAQSAIRDGEEALEELRNEEDA